MRTVRKTVGGPSILAVLRSGTGYKQHSPYAFRRFGHFLSSWCAWKASRHRGFLVAQPARVLRNFSRNEKARHTEKIVSEKFHPRICIPNLEWLNKEYAVSVTKCAYLLWLVLSFRCHFLLSRSETSLRRSSRGSWRPWWRSLPPLHEIYATNWKEYPNLMYQWQMAIKCYNSN